MLVYFKVRAIDETCDYIIYIQSVTTQSLAIELNKQKFQSHFTVSCVIYVQSSEGVKKCEYLLKPVSRELHI